LCTSDIDAIMASTSVCVEPIDLANSAASIRPCWADAVAVC